MMNNSCLPKTTLQHGENATTPPKTKKILNGETPRQSKPLATTHPIGTLTVRESVNTATHPLAPNESMVHSLVIRVAFYYTKTRNTTKNNNNMRTTDKPNTRPNSQAQWRTKTHNYLRQRTRRRKMKISGGGRKMKISHPSSQQYLKKLHHQKHHVNFLKISQG